jgi:hypothetical protein
MKRNSRSSIRWELPVLGVLALQLLLSGWALYRDMASSPERSGEGKAVGTIVYRQRQAERKYSGQVVWGNLSQDTPVYDLDAIRTASDSSATIYLDDKTQIELGEDSLLVLDVGGKAKKLDLSGGSLRVRREAGSGSLKVATRSGDLAMGAGAVSLSDTKAALSIAVTEGKASFKAAPAAAAVQTSATASRGQELRLDTSSAFVVSSGGQIAELALEPLSPVNGKELVAIGSSGYVDFAWMGPVEFAGKLILASDPGFSQGRTERAVSGDSARVELMPGAYYWKVEASSSGSRAAQAAPSRALKFTLAASAAPRLLKPAASTTIASASASASGPKATSLVDFSWSTSPKAEAYRMEVSSSPSFANSELSLRFERTSASTDKLRPGKWYWRVTALFPALGLEAPSAVSSFSIEAAAKPKAEWRGGAAPIALSTLAAKEGALNLSWEPTQGAEGYRVSIARDEGFNDLVYSGDSSLSSMNVGTALDEGSYYVKVVSKIGGKDGEASESRSIVVQKPYPIKLLSPVSGADLKPEARKVDLAWSDPNRGRLFKVELSADPSFSSSLAEAKATSQKASIDLPAGLKGEIYWRVSSLGAKDSVLLSSEPSSFRIPELIPAPLALEPADGQVIDAFRSGAFRFAWKAVSGAVLYRVSLFRLTGGGMTLVREWSTDQTSIDVRKLDFLAIDAYAWKLVALRPEGEAQSPAATSYFKVTQSAQVSAPKLKVPEIIYVH